MPNNDDSLYNSTNMDTSDDMDYINVYNGNNSILVAVFCEILLREVPRGAWELWVLAGKHQLILT